MTSGGESRGLLFPEEEQEERVKGQNEEVEINKLEYVTFLIIGVSYLWPWNCFLAATAYLTDRFEGHEWIQANLSSSIMTVSTISATTCTLFLAQNQRGANYKTRVLMGELCIGGVFLLMALSCLFHTLSIPLYFAFVLLCVFGSSIGVAFAQNGSFALVNTIGSVYTQAIMVGQAVAGVLPAFISFVTALISGDSTSASGLSSALYFLVATAVSSVAFLLFYQSMRRHSKIQGDAEYEPAPQGDHDRNSDQVPPISGLVDAKAHVPLPVLLRKLMAPGFAVFMTFTVTLVYPIFTNTVPSANGIRRHLFVPLVYLFWNVGDLVGRLLCGMPHLVISKSRALVIYGLARILMVPFFFLFSSNMIQSDFLYLLLQFTFGVTNGHLGSSGMMVAPDYVQEEEKEAAGGFMTLVLSLGLAAGSLFSFVVVHLV